MEIRVDRSESTLFAGEGSLKKGYIHVYTGPGKGKTTAALGLGIRAVGAGMKVHMIQFMKGRRYSEIDTIENIDNFTVSQHGRDDFVYKKNPAQVDIDLAQRGFGYAKEVIRNHEYDVVILDEINVAVDYNLISLDDLMDLVKGKPEEIELVLTGRYAHPEIVEVADLVTEMVETKHPYQLGVAIRKGIDF